MKEFISKYEKSIIGTLSGFDRLVLHGRLLSLSVTCGMMDFLNRIGCLLKDFGDYAKEVSEKVKEASLAEAERLKRPIKYLISSQTSKEDIAREVMAVDKITKGMICVLKCVEPCQSYEIFRNKETKKLELQPRLRKCLHFYHYWIDEEFGFMSARIQSWFPFTIQICLNGREWLRVMLEKHGLGYLKSSNCFLRLEDVDMAQKLMDQQLKLSWVPTLNAIAHRINPAFDEIFDKYRTEYYWMVHQSEWATDIMFKSPAELASIYPLLVSGAMSVFSSDDVMRFLADKKLRSTFKGEVVSDYKNRTEGARVKHRVKKNSIKMYDKEGSVLRAETTINEPREYKVFQSKKGDSKGKKTWKKMRKGVADMHRRAMVSQASNNRYLDSLATLDTDGIIFDLVNAVCQPVKWNGKRVRALNPWSESDRTLLMAISRGEFKLNGFRNRDLLQILYKGPFKSVKERQRAAAKITRMIRILRAHKLIQKVPKSHLYRLTPKGATISTATLGYQKCSLQQLNKACA